MKRGSRTFKRLALFLIIAVSVLNIAGNLILYEKYTSFSKGINAYANHQGELSLNMKGPDLGVPQIQIISPENITYASHRTSLNYFLSDNGVLDSCWYSLASPNTNATNVSITCKNNVSSITSVTGSNTWSVYANDTAGNENSSSVSFVVTIPETPGSTPSPSGGSTTTTSPAPYDVIPEELNIFAVSREATEKEIKVVNKGSSNLIINIEVTGIDDIAALSSNRIVLGPGEEEIVILTIVAPDSGIYSGKVVFKSGSYSKETFVIVNTRSEKALFDVTLSVTDSFRYISIGEDLKAFVSLVQLGQPEETDVVANYIIRDFDGKVIFTDSETFRVFDVKSYVKEFPTSQLPAGDYIAGIEVVYPGGFATSSAHFSILGKRSSMVVLLLIVAILLAILAIIYALLRYKKMKNKLSR